MTDQWWDTVLSVVNKKRIVPVIGNDLLLVRKDNETLPLYTYFTRRLGARLRVDPGNLNFREFVLENKNADFFADTREEVFDEIMRENILVRDHLNKLARITGFTFYISTTFDNIFEDILRVERCRPEQGVRTIHYSYPPLAQYIKNEKGSDDIDLTVFKILGSFDSRTCAVTDEEILEYIYSLNRDHSSVDILKNEIIDKKLLFLGCDFPDWLLRFFIRILTDEPFDVSKTDKIIADNYVYKDKKLSQFLKHFKTQIVEFSEEDYRNPVEFIDELYSRWLRFCETSVPKKYQGSVFLSYSHHDKDIVMSVRDEMNAQGINVWMDEDKLRSGDNYRKEIIENVRECTVFIPFISEASVSNPESYVCSVEWDRAISRRKTRENESDSHSFIHPVIIDLTDVCDKRIPEGFRQLTIQKLDTEQLIEIVKKELKTVADDR